MRSLRQRAIEAALAGCEFALREWWFTNAVIWIAVIALALWLDRSLG